MNLRRFLAEAAALVGLAVACALVSNALAGKERRLALPGGYPNATTVTQRAEPAPLAPFVPFAPDANGLPAPTPVPAAEPAPKATPAPPVPASAARRPAPAVAASGTSSSGAAALSPGAAGDELLRRFPPHGQPYVEISGEAAAWLHARGVLFLDARRTKDYAQGHVAGARSFPVWEAEVVKERVEALVGEGRETKVPIVLYCSGGDCEDSHMLAQTLFGAGFENLLVYRDGFPDWTRRGGPVATGGGA